MNQLERDIAHVLGEKLPGERLNPVTERGVIVRARRRRHRNAATTLLTTLLLVVGGYNLALLASESEPTFTSPAAGSRCPDVSVYLQFSVTQEQMDSVQDHLDQDEAVESFTLVRGEELLRRYRDHFRDDPDRLEMIPREGFPDSFDVAVRQDEAIQSFIGRYEDQLGVDLVKEWGESSDCQKSYLSP
jgi:cell division protein FtsX